MPAKLSAEGTYAKPRGVANDCANRPATAVPVAAAPAPAMVMADVPRFTDVAAISGRLTPL